MFGAISASLLAVLPALLAASPAALPLLPAGIPAVQGCAVLLQSIGEKAVHQRGVSVNAGRVLGSRNLKEICPLFHGK